MPIDPRMVAWDDRSSGIDNRMVKWEDIPQQEPKQESGIGNILGNLLAGGVRGAGSIGATIMYPWDKGNDLIRGDREQNLSSLITGNAPMSRNEERRAKMNDALRTLGADPESFAFKAGKIGGEIAGTAGAGGALAKGMTAIPALAKFAPAVQSGGFNLGNAATNSAAINALIRMGGGAAQGGAQAFMVNPEDTGTGAAIGAIAPGAVKVAGAAGNYIGQSIDTGAKKLMQSALKPTIDQLRTGKADTAVNTLLDLGINANSKGVTKLQGMVDDLNAQIAQSIQNSGAVIDKNRVLNTLNDTRTKFSNQVSPTADLNSIQKVADDFLAHPTYPGSSMPVQAAQEMKQGTYRVLKNKYGEIGSADTEAQKALARGLKEEISSAVPGVAMMNKLESQLLDTLSVTERRALMDANKNPLGLAALASNPVGWAAFMADRSALFKSLAARLAHQTAQAASKPRLPGAVDQYGLLGAPSVIAISP